MKKAITLGLLFVWGFLLVVDKSEADPLIHESVKACVFSRDVVLNDAVRSQIADCLGWQSLPKSSSICLGRYQAISPIPLASPEEIRIQADRISFYQTQDSRLSGRVEVQQGQQIVSAETAHLYRDPKSKQVKRIEFHGNVHYLEPDRLMIARKAWINPQDHSGEVEDVLYRFKIERGHALLPAWGRASLIKRFANKNYLLQQASYTTCAPQDKAWELRAKSITIDDANAKGIARDATLRVHNWPVLSVPYLSFPTSHERKSGFLMPLVGYSNIGGFDTGLPYYWNIAPNQDMTLTPHVYSRRGVMMGGEYRFLTPKSFGIISGNVLPDDRAFGQFLAVNRTQFPHLHDYSNNRWSIAGIERTQLTQFLQFNATVQRVSDDYYFQDFSSNLSVITQRQLLSQMDLSYSTPHWLFRGMGQSYQTLQPINEAPISPVYARVPQLLAKGFYGLPWHSNLKILGEYDQFRWPGNHWFVPWNQTQGFVPWNSPQGGVPWYPKPDPRLPFNPLPWINPPQGPRLYLNPILSQSLVKSWGFLKPTVEMVMRNYEVQNNWQIPNAQFNRATPRVSLDGGLYFERGLQWGSSEYTQTLEPRLFYLGVPYQNQAPIPVYDSGYMIFNVDQLVRNNRFSGLDRIADANQLSYMLSSRWLRGGTGDELAFITLGQIRYFSDRKVQLCYSPFGVCMDNPHTFGFTSDTSTTSPLASRGALHLTPRWDINGDYVWDPATHASNNADLNVRYQRDPRSLASLGYSYLVNADPAQIHRHGPSINNALHQGIVAFAWPLNERWSTVGAYSHNLSEDYSMMSLFGVQYDSCCWAMRVLGGRTFRNLDASLAPQYNNNIYLQFLFKGLGSVANHDPNELLSTYIPGYNDLFH